MVAHELLTDLSEAGVTVTARGDRLVIRPASKLTDTHREALRRAKPELLTLLSTRRAVRNSAELADGVWTEGDIYRFLARRDRLLRWGWSEAEAEAMADRLVKRDLEADDRVSCTDCRHYRPGRCGNHQRAGLHSPDLSRDLAELLQRCPGHDPATAAPTDQSRASRPAHTAVAVETEHAKDMNHGTI